MVAQQHTSTTQSSASPAPVSTVTTPGSSQTNSPSIPPGFNPIGPGSSTSYIPIPAIPYGYAPYSSFPVFDPNYESTFSMAGFYGGRGSGHVNFGNGRASGSTGRGSFSSNGGLSIEGEAESRDFGVGMQHLTVIFHFVKKDRCQKLR